MTENQIAICLFCAVMTPITAAISAIVLFYGFITIDESLSRISENLSRIGDKLNHLDNLKYLPNIASHLKDMAEPDEDDCDGEEDDDTEQTYTITITKKERE